MARTTIVRNGIVYRTKLMKDEAKARAFANCLRGNSRFCDVEIVPNTKANGGAHVTFRPVSRTCQEAMYQQEWDTRELRGYEQAGNYEFIKENGFWYCINLESGEVYEVTPFSCSCADYHYRCNHAGLHCKHIHALQVQADRATQEKRLPLAA